MTATALTYGVVPNDVLLSYDGLSFLKGIIDGKIPAPPIAETLGFDLVSAEKGTATFEVVPELKHYNPIGVVHGGLAMTVLDSALGCAVMTTLAKGEAYTTLEIKVNLTRALTKDTGLVRATARLIHRGRTTATAEADLRDDKGNLYAHATTTCIIFPMKK
ncbi:MAG: hypothetical protein QOG38_2919 [Hyphomicrobiales bacterium]|nr:hypothetical protein [Hyphomicrobiales bacterium]